MLDLTAVLTPKDVPPSSHTRYYKPFLRNLAEATTIDDIRAIAMDETLHDVWGPQHAE